MRALFVALMLAVSSGRLLADASAVGLPPLAAAARDRGVKAADAGHWDDAVAAFREAQDRVYCSPDPMFNLALALDKQGSSTSAALWYRTYLTAKPNAAQASTLRQRIEVLRQSAETRVRELFAEAERTALTLADTALVTGGRSPRAQSLETIAFYAYLADDFGTGDRVSGLISYRPERLEVLRKQQGLWGWSFPLRVAEATVRFQRAPSSERLTLLKLMVEMHSRRLDIAAASRLADTLSAQEMRNMSNGKEFLDDLISHGAYAAVARLLRDIFSTAGAWDPVAFGSAARLAFQLTLSGDVDGARDVAQRAIAHIEAFNPSYYERFVKGDYGGGGEAIGWLTRHMLLKIIATRANAAGVDRVLHETSGAHFVSETREFGRDVLILVAVLSGASEARNAVNKISAFSAEAYGSAGTNAVYQRDIVVPAILAVAENDLTAARAAFAKYREYAVKDDSYGTPYHYLGFGQDREFYDTSSWLLLNLATRMGHWGLALDFARTLPNSRVALRDLERFAGNRPDGRAVIDLFRREVCGGSVPLDLAKLTWQVKQAQDALLENFAVPEAKWRKLAAGQPDQLPSDIGLYAAGLLATSRGIAAE